MYTLYYAPGAASMCVHMRASARARPLPARRAIFLRRYFPDDADALVAPHAEATNRVASAAQSRRPGQIAAELETSVQTGRFDRMGLTRYGRSTLDSVNERNPAATAEAKRCARLAGLDGGGAATIAGCGGTV